jgi:hypothetical protein
MTIFTCERNNGRGPHSRHHASNPRYRRRAGLQPSIGGCSEMEEECLAPSATCRGVGRKAGLMARETEETERPVKDISASVHPQAVLHPVRSRPACASGPGRPVDHGEGTEAGSPAEEGIRRPLVVERAVLPMHISVSLNPAVAIHCEHGHGGGHEGGSADVLERMRQPGRARANGVTRPRCPIAPRA